MIPISTWNLLVVIDILFIVYAVIDHRNRLYANVTIAFLAGLLAAYLSSAITSNIVYDGVTTTIVNSPSAGNFLNLVATIMFIYCIIMVYEVINEAFEKKAMAQVQEEDDRV